MTSHQESSFHWHYAELDDANFQIHGHTLFFIVLLFSVVLLAALLFLYARWVCRISPPPPPPHVAARAAAGLDAATISSFPLHLHSKEEKGLSESECCICLGIFCGGDKVKVLPPCRHCFHSECVDRWLAAHSSCPLCRHSLLLDSPV